MTPEIPSKLYYSISEVAEMTGVKAHVLRYWEGEFSTLRPKKTRSGSRRYRQSDIEEVLAIRELLYDKGFRIAGAKRVRLDAHRKHKDDDQSAPAQLAIKLSDMDPDQKLALVRAELEQIRDLLAGIDTAAQKEREAKGGA